MAPLPWLAAQAAQPIPPCHITVTLKRVSQALRVVLEYRLSIHDRTPSAPSEQHNIIDVPATKAAPHNSVPSTNRRETESPHLGEAEG